MCALGIDPEGLSEALRKIRGGYRSEGEQGPLWDILGLEKYDEEYIKALLVKFIDHFFSRSDDGDILLMAFGLLKGYDRIKKIGDRRKLYLDESDYLKPNESNNKSTRDGLRKKEDRLIATLSDKITDMYKISDFTNDVDEYLERSQESGDAKTISRAILPEPVYPDRIATPHLRARDFPVRNQFFTGRQDILEKLHATFFEKNNAIQVITGKGGIGKSQTAREYAHKFVDEYTDAV